MNYVYKYTDTMDSTVKYIGVVCRKSENALYRRIYEHSKNDEWAQGRIWKIEYITVPTKNDALALESHFIEFYGTKEWFNKAKTTLGLLSFLKEEIKWETAYEKFETSITDIKKYEKDVCIVSYDKLPDMIAESLANIKQSLIVIDYMLKRNDYSMFTKEKLLEDRMCLIDGLEKYNEFLDSRKTYII